MSIPHNFSIIAGIMGRVVGTSGGGGGGGTPNIISVTGPSETDEGTAATITVVTENFPDGNTTLNWSVSRPEDFSISSGTVVIGAGPITTTYQEVSGATVGIDPEQGDTVYNYTFGGTLSGSGIGFNGPIPSLNERIGSTSYYRGTLISAGLYKVNRAVTVGGNGTATFNITPDADGVLESDETFTVTVSGTAGGTPVSRTSALLTIKDVTGGNIPAGTFAGRPLALGDVINLRAESISDGFAQARSVFTTRFSREGFGIGGSTKGFEIRVERDPGFDTYTTALWFAPSGTSNALTEAAVQIYRNTNATPTAVRMEYKLAGTGWIDLGWTDTPNDGMEATASFSTQAEAGAGADQFREKVAQIRYYGRSPGFNDTLLAEFQFRIQAYAEGTD